MSVTRAFAFIVQPPLDSDFAPSFTTSNTFFGFEDQSQDPYPLASALHFWADGQATAFDLGVRTDIGAKGHVLAGNQFAIVSYDTATVEADSSPTRIEIFEGSQTTDEDGAPAVALAKVADMDATAFPAFDTVALSQDLNILLLQTDSDSGETVAGSIVTQDGTLFASDVSAADLPPALPDPIAPEAEPSAYQIYNDLAQFQLSSEASGEAVGPDGTLVMWQYFVYYGANQWWYSEVRFTDYTREEYEALTGEPSPHPVYEAVPFVSFETAADVGQGDADDNFLIGTLESDFMDGRRGQDSLFGLSGDDTLKGGYGQDYLDGGADDDALDGGGGNDLLGGGNGDDTLSGGTGWDQMYGENGNDLLEGAWGRDEMFGGLGQDTLFGGYAEDTMFGGADDDIVAGDRGQDSLVGDAGNDTLYGGVGRDSLDGSSGDDKLFGGWGTDVLDGGDGDDILRGAGGADTLSSGAGDDSLFGGGGHDELVADSGNNTLSGGWGNNTMTDGSGDDLILANGVIDDVYLGGGNNTLMADANVTFINVAHDTTGTGGFSDGVTEVQNFDLGVDKIDLTVVGDTLNESDPNFMAFLAGEISIDGEDAFLSLGDGRSLKLVDVVEDDSVTAEDLAEDIFFDL